MKFSEPVTVTSAVRITWMLTALVFLGLGLGLVWWPTSQTIDAVKVQARILYDEANQNESDAQHAAQLRAVAKRVSDDVRELSGQESQSALTAATLALLYRESHAHGVDIRSIVPAAVPSPAATLVSVAALPAENVLVGSPIEIDARGRFRDLLSFISDLPRHNVLIDVSGINLADRGDRSIKPVLGATIHATIYRYQGIAEKGAQHASGAP